MISQRDDEGYKTFFFDSDTFSQVSCFFLTIKSKVEHQTVLHSMRSCSLLYNAEIIANNKTFPRGKKLIMINYCKSTPGVRQCFTPLFSLSLMLRINKLDCLSLASLFGVIHLSVSPDKTIVI
jgi:hypothetical protein